MILMHLIRCKLGSGNEILEYFTHLIGINSIQSSFHLSSILFLVGGSQNERTKT